MTNASLPSCLTLSDPMDYSPPGFSVRGVLQARMLEWVAMPSSREYSRPRDRTHISCVSWSCRWVTYHWATREVPGSMFLTPVGWLAAVEGQRQESAFKECKAWRNMKKCWPEGKKKKKCWPGTQSRPSGHSTVRTPRLEREIVKKAEEKYIPRELAGNHKCLDINRITCPFR